MSNDKIIILIPAYCPNEKLLDICDNLLKDNYREIVVISDGNEGMNQNLLEKLKEREITILYHAVNQGKGRALKTGFNYICLKYQKELNHIGILTIDADGQHTQQSIRMCCEKLRENIEQRNWIFGCRNFDSCYDENGNIGKIPFRSKIGNETTKVILKFVYGLNLSDTQTGLRGFPGSVLKELLNIEGERYEYEMNQILYSKKHGIELIEVSIETIYEEQNKSSHFNPIVDSWKIYKPILKDILPSFYFILIGGIIFILLIIFGF